MSFSKIHDRMKEIISEEMMSGDHVPQNISTNYLMELIVDIKNRIGDLENSPFGKSPIYAPIFDRLQKLEEAHKADFDTAKDIIYQGAQTHASILKLDARVKDIEYRLNAIVELPIENKAHYILVA